MTETTIKPWFRNHELAPALVWTGTAGWFAYQMKPGYLSLLALSSMLLAVFLATYRFHGSMMLLKRKRALLGRPVTVVKPDLVIRKMRRRPDHLWLGWGFEWGRPQAQLLSELEDRDVDRMIPVWMKHLFRGRPKHGEPYIHGIEPGETDIFVPLEDLAGHCFVPATTGAIKTRLLGLIALQEIMREPKRTVIVIDPKGDVGLLDLIRWACRAAGREADFGYLHPAFPRESVRIDLMKNWTTTTEDASRVAEMMGGDESSAPFKAFGWQVTNNIIQALLAIGERPQLKNLRRYIEGGPDDLLYRVITRYIESLGENPTSALERYMGEARKIRGRAPTTPVETRAAVLYYKRELQTRQPLAAIDGLLMMYEHDAAHFTKMIATLQPILTMLTSDELEALLSPDYDDPDDMRELLDNARILRTGRVLYIGLHSMPDATVSQAIGSLYLADLVAVLGERYIRNEKTPKVTLFLDEANEIVNPPLVQMLNKGRGAGLMVYFFTQTVADFITKYGAEAPAQQLLANANNVLIGRILEEKTLEYATQKMGETKIEEQHEQFGVSPVTEDRKITNYHVSYGSKSTRTREPRVRETTFGELPDLEYFGRFSGGRVVKGRIPVVTD